MKKIYFLVVVLCGFVGGYGQIVNIPDGTFKTKLLAADPTNAIAKDVNGNQIKIDLNGDSQIQVSEALNVYTLDLNTLGGTMFGVAGIDGFVSLKYLDVGYYYSTVLNVSMLSNLEVLVCNGSTQLNSLNISGLVNLKKLECINNINLSTIDVSTLINLEYLNIARNQFVYSLNLIGLSNLNKLIELNLTNNVLTNRNIDFTGFIALKKIILRNTNITGLNVFNINTLEYIDCKETRDLNSLNTNGLFMLKYLDCGYSSLSSINLQQNINLEYVDLTYNDISSINISGLSRLVTFICRGYSLNVRLNTINVNGCINLKTINLENNNIGSLDLSSTINVENLNLSRNSFLSYLYIDNLTKLLNLNISHTALTGINLSENIHISNLIIDSSNIEFLDVSNLPDLYWFSANYCPFLKTLILKNGRPASLNGNSNISYDFNSQSLRYICADENNFYYYQQLLPQYNNTNCQINSYCNFHPGGVYYEINGKSKIDNNNNGCDINDSILPSLKYRVSRGTVTTNFLSNTSGNYAIPVQAGTYTLTPILENQTYFTVSPSTINISFPIQPSPFTQNFCVTANGVHPDLEISLLPLNTARPGFDSHYKLIYKNKGNTTQSGNVNLAFNDAILDVVSVNPVVTTQILNNLSWSFTNLLPFETREIAITLNLNSPMETPAVNGGDILNYTTTITSSAIDDLPNDNTFVFNQTVVNSFDPNDKTCLEGATISPSKVGDYVHYMIRFENTGTFPAENIVVKDMIDTAKFDVSSLIPVKASHSFVTNISSTNKVEFIFENINLPFDDANNDGYVAFKIKTKPSLVLGNTFSNTASIYFDYNFPIVTNTAITTIAALAVQDFEFSNYFNVYPNPVSEVLNIGAKQNIAVKSINIYNTVGQLVLVIPNAQDAATIDVSNLVTGNYFVKINTDKGTSNTKFVKN